MSKVFKLHTGTDVYQDWDEAKKYGNKAISEIEDPDGATAKKEITSIPSPFARIDLVKSAFRYLVDNGLNGKTMYHKIVSDCWDIAEIFFNYDKYKNMVEILVWDKTVDLPLLLESKNVSHKIVGETLKMYMDQDAKNYNFADMNRIYMLNYIGPNKPKAINIIGATSPATLFFSSANNLKYVSENMRSGQDKFFDNEYAQLHERDHDFITYMFAFRNACPEFANKFPEVYEYMEKVYSQLRDAHKAEIDQLSVQSVDSYQSLQFNSNTVEILGYPFHKRSMSGPVQSDFEIASKIYQGPIKPLVLPIEKGNNYSNLKYIQDTWGQEDQAPYMDATPLEQRILPFDGRQYPYITIGDFLEDNLIQISSRRNDLKENAFFDGNREDKVEGSYLLPIKPFFFRFFTPEELMGTVAGGKKMFELRFNASGITAVLRVPINGGKNHIEYSRVYMMGTTGIAAKPEQNQGSIVNSNFALALFPNAKFASAQEAYYRIGLVTPIAGGEQFDLNCFTADKPNTINRLSRNTRDTNYQKSEVFAIDKQHFDYMQIAIGATVGTIIPKFHQSVVNSQFTFAIDLGTSNTNVEYQINNNPAKPFDITAEDLQLQPLADYPVKYSMVFATDLVPAIVGAGQKYQFPTRTALSFSKQVNWHNYVTPMAEANVAFTYERLSEYVYNEILTNLKWANNSESQLKCYIESLFMLLRTKVLLNHGDLRNTRIVWFYPISMSEHRLSLFKTTWNDAYQKFFGGPTSNIVPMSESVAPYEYFKSARVNAANTVTVDIGGGTTDIVFADQGEVKYITSFRFAADSVFGDGYADPNFAVQNGIVLQFKDTVKDVLESTGQDDLIDIYNAINSRNRSTEIASFLFSLKNNKSLVDDPSFDVDKVDFNRLLQLDGKQKIVFVFFFASLIYHIANIMKAKELAQPRYIAFSGNGSKILNVVSSDNTLLAKFTKLIIEKVYDAPYDKNGLEIIRVDNPKQATCEGGISGFSRAVAYESITDNKIVLKGLDNKSFVEKETYGEIRKNTSYLKEIEKEAEKFIDFVLALNEDFSFRDKFGIENAAVEVAKSICYRDLAQFAQNGLTQKMEEVTDNDKVEETMFFYPLVGMLSALAREIFEKLK